MERVVPWHILSDELREESLQICYSAEPHAHGDGDIDSETRNAFLRSLTARLRISRSFVVMTWNLFGIACLKRAFMNHPYKISGFFTQRYDSQLERSHICTNITKAFILQFIAQIIFGTLCFLAAIYCSKSGLLMVLIYGTN